MRGKTALFLPPHHRKRERYRCPHPAATASECHGAHARCWPTSPLPCCLLDAQLRIQYANHAAEQLLATGLSRLRNQAFSTFWTMPTAAPPPTWIWHCTPSSPTPSAKRGCWVRRNASWPWPITPSPPARHTGHRPRPPGTGRHPGGQQLLVELHPLDRLIHTTAKTACSPPTKPPAPWCAAWRMRSKTRWAAFAVPRSC